jgi:hypothetical protein
MIGDAPQIVKLVSSMATPCQTSALASEDSGTFKAVRGVGIEAAFVERSAGD